MKKLYLILLFSLSYFITEAQLLKGQVKDTGGNILPGCTVLLLDTKDSTMLTYAKTKNDGFFDIKIPKKDTALLQISYVGFEKYYKLIKNTGADQNIGEILMHEESKGLDLVVVKGERAAVEIKKDTVEFNAGSFKVQENAVAEDLLKRLPGVEVDRDGAVTAQGKSVARVLVDGKEFFGRDPKMATKNIPANSIDKVQVFDKKSDRAEFTGIDDGEEETTINLKLRADKKQLGFGRISLGEGVDATRKSRYNLAANYSAFKNGNQLSFVGNANNINQQSFSNNEFSMVGVGRGGGAGISFGGGNGGQGANRNGLLRNISGGLNFNQILSTKTEMNGSYSYTNTNTIVTQISSTESIIGNLETTGSSNSAQNSDLAAHRINMTLNSKINPKNSVRWIHRVDYRSNGSSTESNNEEYLKGSSQLRNSTDRTNNSTGNSMGYTSQALYQKSFDKKGRTFTTNLSLGINNGNTDGTLVSKNGLFSSIANSVIFTNLNQVSNQISERLNMGAEISYTEPLNQYNFIEANYSYQKVNNDLDKEVFNVKDASKTLDTTLSNIYKNDYTYNRVGLSYKVSKENWNANFGGAIQASNLEGDLILRKQLIEKRFINPVFNGRLRYSFTGSKTMDLSYNTNVSEPSMTQLSPVPDNSNPLNIYVGNPDLKPQYAQRLNFNFRNFNQLNFTSFFVTAGLNFTKDNITDSVTYNTETLAKTRKPINYGNNVGLNTVANYGFRISTINTRFSVSSSINISKSQTLINNVDNLTNSFTNSNTIRADFTPADNFILGLSARLSFNNTSYSQNTQLNPNYTNQAYTADLQWQIPNFLNFTSNLDYAIYNYATNGSVQKIPFWNASAFRSVFKNKRGEVRLSVNDILKRNQVVSQTASANTFTEQRSNALGRFFMLSFTYNINGGTPTVTGGQGGQRPFRNN